MAKRSKERQPNKPGDGSWNGLFARLRGRNCLGQTGPDTAALPSSERQRQVYK